MRSFGRVGPSGWEPLYSLVLSECERWAAPLTRADIPELIKAVADALTKRDPPEDPGGPGGHKFTPFETVTS